MKSSILITFLLCAAFRSVYSIKCYVCNSSDSANPFQCGEFIDRYDRVTLQPQECSSVHDAKFCVKHTGVYGVNCILCYQCSTSETIDCTDAVINMPDSPLSPKSCEHIYEAAYCIKWTSLSGGIGARRFCSEKNLGNYCGYVENVGDREERYSCIFTCDTDGCNTGSTINVPGYIPVAFFIGAIILRNLF